MYVESGHVIILNKNKALKTNHHAVTLSKCVSREVTCFDLVTEIKLMTQGSFPKKRTLRRWIYGIFS